MCACLRVRVLNIRRRLKSIHTQAASAAVVSFLALPSRIYYSDVIVYCISVTVAAAAVRHYANARFRALALAAACRQQTRVRI